ncbi:hypothetical protein DBO86_22835 [Pseudomonas indoloxydans]|uniref:Phage head-tail adapter protein n=2 Tax=Ectopseudomonas oleovorans TaxID=301 RepID=A0A2T5PGP6_ECTOL|nr:hypothetical protein DBO86_22835 [Pseudomonas indoloxydans]
MNKTILRTLADGIADYHSATGAVLASGVEVIMERDIERFDAGGGMLDRAVTITVRKSLLQPFDRQGAFAMDGKTWHIDGIERDDGHMITLYVVP